MTATVWVAAGALLGLLLGLVLMLLGRGMRQRRGLGEGRTVSLDRVTLTSRRLGLTGRPDRLIRAGDMVIIEEWKSSRRVWPSHRAQMGVYFLLVEDQLGVRPTHGFIVCGDGTRHRIDNTEELRAWVLGLAGQIRAARARVGHGEAIDDCRGGGKRWPQGSSQRNIKAVPGRGAGRSRPKTVTGRRSTTKEP